MRRARGKLNRSGPEALLDVRDVHQQFGALKVLTGISLAVPPGQAVGVVGPNGAGKSTLLDIVAGGRRPDGGRGLAGRHRRHHGRGRRRTRLGLGRTYQVPRPFPALTVFENALVAAVRGAGLRRRAAYQVAYGALERTGLGARANVRPASSPCWNANGWNWPGPWLRSRRCCCWTRSPAG